MLQNISNTLPTSTVKHPSRQYGGTQKSCIVWLVCSVTSELVATQFVTAWHFGVYVQHNKSGLLDVHVSCFHLYYFWSSWSFPRDDTTASVIG
jgi:hypothetical protein